MAPDTSVLALANQGRSVPSPGGRRGSVGGKVPRLSISGISRNSNRSSGSADAVLWSPGRRRENNIGGRRSCSGGQAGMEDSIGELTAEEQAKVDYAIAEAEARALEASTEAEISSNTPYRSGQAIDRAAWRERFNAMLTTGGTPRTPLMLNPKKIKEEAWLLELLTHSERQGIILPFSRFRTTWDLLVFSFVIYTALSLPIILAYPDAADAFDHVSSLEICMDVRRRPPPCPLATHASVPRHPCLEHAARGRCRQGAPTGSPGQSASPGPPRPITEPALLAAGLLRCRHYPQLPHGLCGERGARRR